jgi:hypothetical protein
LGLDTIPVAPFTLLGSVLDHLRLQAAHASMDFLFDFAQGRFGMRTPPFPNIGQNLLTHLSPVLLHFLALLFPHFVSAPILPCSPFPV